MQNTIQRCADLATIRTIIVLADEPDQFGTVPGAVLLCGLAQEIVGPEGLSPLRPNDHRSGGQPVRVIGSIPLQRIG